MIDECVHICALEYKQTRVFLLKREQGHGVETLQGCREEEGKTE
jgi:hypothetical protein